MVLIDTPVWIRFLMDCEPFVRELKRLLAVLEIWFISAAARICLTISTNYFRPRSSLTAML